MAVFETSDGLPAERHIPGCKDCQRERPKASPFVFWQHPFSPKKLFALMAEPAALGDDSVIYGALALALNHA
jgi:hypothetical protein